MVSTINATHTRWVTKVTNQHSRGPAPYKMSHGLLPAILSLSKHKYEYLVYSVTRSSTCSLLKTVPYIALSWVVNL